MCYTARNRAALEKEAEALQCATTVHLHQMGTIIFGDSGRAPPSDYARSCQLHSAPRRLCSALIMRPHQITLALVSYALLPVGYALLPVGYALLSALLRHLQSTHNKADLRQPRRRSGQQ